jgi:23S rRNA (cytidine1920-2'-O)/16S rRNA (cytidine1409-2'-O)-methyltransferase
MRLDQWLVLNKKVRSRSQAEEVISRGEVSFFDPKKSIWIVLTKASYKVLDEITEDQIKVESELTSYVARSGLKLKRAIERLKLNIQDLKCLDVGQSTGGFTQVLLEKGATQVIGLDVGTAQLSSEFLSHPNVISFENLDIRSAQNNLEFKKYTPFQMIVVDVSFISLTLVLESLQDLLIPGGQVLALVKPQFEVSAKELDKKGLIKNPETLKTVQEKIYDFVKSKTDFTIEAYLTSELEGKDGNKEFFIYLKS